MSQTDTVAGVLVLAFIIFIVVRGDLGKYLRTLGL